MDNRLPNIQDAESLRWRRQWLLTRNARAVPGYFMSTSLSAGWMLYSHCDALIRTISVGARNVVILGTASRDDRLGPLLTPREQRDARLDTTAVIRRLAGVYTVLVDDGEEVVVYTDPGGLANVFYSETEIASSPTLLGELVRDSEIDQQFKLRGTDNWYPGSITPFKGVRVLLANHCMIAGSQRSSRFWPVAESMRDMTPVEAVEVICQHTRTGVRNLAIAAPLILSVTGGRDSRINLAAVIAERVPCSAFTLQSADMGHREAGIVRDLVGRSGVRHRFLEQVDSSPRLLGLYDEISGGLATGARRTTIGSFAAMAGGRSIHLNGNLGAIFKSFYWPARLPARVSVDHLAKEFIQRPRCIIDGLAEWLASVPPLPVPTILNLMYLEQRGGRWMGIGERASQLLYDSYSPFCSRSVFEAMSGMPIEWQRGGRCMPDLVAHLAPTLAEVPYCSGTSLWKRSIPKSVKALGRRLLRR